MRQTFDSRDVAQNRAPAAIGYLLFFVPLFACPNSRLGRFTANQGLIVWAIFILAHLLLVTLLGSIPLIGWLFRTVGHIAEFADVIVAVLAMLNLMNRGEASELPFVGHFRIIR